MDYMVHVSNTMWRDKNQPSNPTSCSDNALRLLVLMAGILYWGLQVKSSFWIWGCILKGLFERGIFWRAKSRLKGIEDFTLGHWADRCKHCSQHNVKSCIFHIRRSEGEAAIFSLSRCPIIQLAHDAREQDALSVTQRLYFKSVCAVTYLSVNFV